jgi:hypothetical protein
MAKNYTAEGIGKAPAKLKIFLLFFVFLGFLDTIDWVVWF